MSMELVKHITRQMVRANPGTLFVFGDNMQRRGLGGQAKEMRGEPNAVGIPTKWSPSMAEKAFFKDVDFDKVKAEIDKGFARLRDHRGPIVWPADGIGTGLAQLQARAPRIWQLIEDGRLGLTKI